MPDRSAFPSPIRRTLLRALPGMGALLLLPGAHAGFNFFTSEYTATREELQALIARRFPLTRGYGALFSMRLSDPQLGLDAAANRTALTASVAIASSLLAAQAVHGTLSVSSALRYDAPARTLRLEQPRAESVRLEGVTGRDAERLQRIGAVVAQELLQGQPLRTFTEQELSVGLKTYEIGEITVQEDGIKVQLK